MSNSMHRRQFNWLQLQNAISWPRKFCQRLSSSLPFHEVKQTTAVSLTAIHPTSLYDKQHSTLKAPLSPLSQGSGSYWMATRTGRKPFYVGAQDVEHAERRCLTPQLQGIAVAQTKGAWGLTHSPSVQFAQVKFLLGSL
jgi:hypothetical protein